MANNFNEANFKGRLTKDAVYTVTQQNGTKVFKLSLAVPNGKPKLENGQLVKENGRQVFTDDVLFIELTAFGKTADDLVNGGLNPFLVKGAAVKVCAKFEGVNTYPKTDGSGMGASANWVIRSYDDVALLSPPKPKTQGQGQGQTQGQTQGYSQQQSQSNNGGQTQQYGNPSQQRQQYNQESQYGGNQQFGNNTPNYQDPNDLPF